MNQQSHLSSYRRLCAMLCAAAFLLTACGKPDKKATEIPAALDAAAIGEMLFHDPSLSASGKQSCATCHSPAHAHAQPNALAVQRGGPALDQPGTRAVPSLRYLAATPAFSFDAEGTASGGFNHDGSAASLAGQAERPLLAANEMANLTRTAVVEKLRKASYAAQFLQVFGAHSLDDAEQAFGKLAFALEEYQLKDPKFAPFDSKYDAYLAGRVALSAAETRGLTLFNDAKKANCAACHPSARSEEGRPPLFTDFTYDSLGVPRNPAIAANADGAYVDLGLCRAGLGVRATQESECGKFKVPTLRNVATRQVFFHNGQFTSLREAVAFYLRRDTHPEEWYPRGAKGRVEKFNDMPRRFHANVNIDEAPYDRKRGDKPALSEREIDDLVSFLGTLNDGYTGQR